MHFNDIWLRRGLAGLFLGVAFMLAACAGQMPEGGGNASPRGHSSGAVAIADESIAASIAREIFDKGGSAGDAAVAVAFALTVTYPASAGLGGGGECLYFNRARNETASFDFLPSAPSSGGNLGVPGLVRGLALIHSTYGRLSWDRVVAPAQRLAEVGFRASHSYVQRLSGDIAVRTVPKEYVDLMGGWVTDDRLIRQTILAKTLTEIRRDGPDAFYTGIIAEMFAAESEGQLTPADLASYRPSVALGEIRSFGNNGTLIMPALSQTSGSMADALLRAWSSDGATTVKAALATQGIGDMPLDLGSTGFIVADGAGNVAACGLTMYGPFGARFVAKSVGIAFAPAPRQSTGGIAGALLQPALVVADGDVRYASVAGGNADSLAAYVDALNAYSIGGIEAVRPIVKDRELGPVGVFMVGVCDEDMPSRQCRYGPTTGSFGHVLTTDSDAGHAFHEDEQQS